MATPLSVTRMLSALKAEGCRVVEYRSWRTHNRNHVGSWGPVHGVMLHHTVTSGTDSSVRLCYEGRSDLPGPLCQAVAAKDGRLFLVGHGRANHAGLGDDDVLRAVISEDYGSAPPGPNENNTDGNARFYGLEAINLGNGRDPWPEVQVAAMARWAAAICRAHGWTEKSVIGHKEWTNTKIDPRTSPGGADVSMTALRRRVRALLAAPPGQPPEEDDVPDTFGRYDATDRTLTPGEWTVIPIDGTDLLTGARSYSATVILTLRATAGSTLQGRFFHQRPDGSRWTGSLFERTATPRNSYLDFHHEGAVAATEKVRFEVGYFPLDADDQAAATLISARVRGLYWK